MESHWQLRRREFPGQSQGSAERRWPLGGALGYARLFSENHESIMNALFSGAILPGFDDSQGEMSSPFAGIAEAGI